MGRFTSLYEFCEKVDLGAVNRRMIESLIKAGAMDSLEGTRASCWPLSKAPWKPDSARWNAIATAARSGLFGELLDRGEAARRHPLPNVPDWTDKEKLAGEKEMLGFYVTGHPLDHYMDKVAELATHTTSNLEGLAKGTEVALCGVLTGIAAQAQ